MLHNVDLILTLASGLSAALVLGFITQKLRMSPIVGYLLAGIIVGPYSPGFVADADTASQCAEIGIILLMFGVGLHFHLKDLLAVQRIVLPVRPPDRAAAARHGRLAQFRLVWAAGRFRHSHLRRQYGRPDPRPLRQQSCTPQRATWPSAGWWWKISSPSFCWCFCPPSWAATNSPKASGTSLPLRH
ncbi:MAG: cation:proton antiporter [Bilophila wadsworthia]